MREEFFIRMFVIISWPSVFLSTPSSSAPLPENIPSIMLESEKERVYLYSYWRSSCSWRVRIGLNLKKIEYDVIPVNLKAGEQCSSDPLPSDPKSNEPYSVVNPSMLVPTLIIDGMKLHQSHAILEYLDERKQSSAELRLLPRDPKRRAIVRLMTGVLAEDCQPIQNFRVLKKVGSLISEEIQKFGVHNSNIDDQYLAGVKSNWAAFWIDRALVTFESLVLKFADTENRDEIKFSAFNELSIADVCLIPQLYNARRFGIDVEERFPILAQIEQNCLSIQAFRDAVPANQIDAPETA